MKLFKQLALVSAVAAASSGAFALEALSDDTMAAKTGQDGITITIQPSEDGIRMDRLFIHDNDGLDASETFAGSTFNATEQLGGTDTAGALVIYGDADNGAEARSGTAGSYTYAKTQKGMIIQGGNIAVKVDTDGGTGSNATTNNAFINASVEMTGDTHIGIGKIGVGTSKAISEDATSGNANHTGANQRGLIGSDNANATSGGQTPNDILGAMSVQMSGTKMNIQLGSQPQGAMVLMDATINGGLKLNNLEVIDYNGWDDPSISDAAEATEAGGLMVKQLTITDNGSTDLKLKSKIDIDRDAGLVLAMQDATAAGMYIYAQDVGFTDGNGTYGDVGTGTANNIIGDVEVVGLTMGSSTISISGH